MAVLGMPPCRSFLGSSPLFQKKKKHSARGKAQTDRAKRQGATTRRQKKTKRQHQAPEPPKRPATQRKRPRRAHTESQPPRAQVTLASFWVLPRMLGDLGGASTLKVKGSFCKKLRYCRMSCPRRVLPEARLLTDGLDTIRHSVLQKPVWNVPTRESLAVLDTVRWRSGAALLHNGSVRHQP